MMQAAFSPLCAPLSRGVSGGGAQPPQHRQRIVARIWIQFCLKSFQNPCENPSRMIPKSFQIVAYMVQNRSLEGVWSCFVACLRPKAPVGCFLDTSGAALGRFLAHLGRLLGGSAPGSSWAPSWGVLVPLKASRRRLGRKLDAKMEPSWH